MRQSQTYPVSQLHYEQVKKTVKNFLIRSRDQGILKYQQIDARGVTSAALLVLCEAATKFNPNKNISFERYAYTRVRDALEEWLV